jgi:hypothetical protein
MAREDELATVITSEVGSPVAFSHAAQTTAAPRSSSTTSIWSAAFWSSCRSP